MYTIEVRNAQGVTLEKAEGKGDARLVYRQPYAPGDVLVLKTPGPFAICQVDASLPPAQVYLPDEGFTFAIPFGDAVNGYAPTAFSGDLHTIWVGPVEDGFLHTRRNVACNPVDQRGVSGCYPHAMANVETRGEAQFWARNAIDGTRFNNDHGPWPFHSWGIGERRDAWLRVDFGRPVTIDAVALTLRADFPHDAWWEKGTLDASDGFSMTLSLKKTAEMQVFDIGTHTVTWVRLRELIKADDPSPFPALTQLEVYGADICL